MYYKILLNDKDVQRVLGTLIEQIGRLEEKDDRVADRVSLLDLRKRIQEQFLEQRNV